MIIIKKQLSTIDLFAGIGGFTQGFLRVNQADLPFAFEPKLLIDVDPTACSSFRKNFSLPYLSQDLYKVGGGDILKIS